MGGDLSFLLYCVFFILIGLATVLGFFIVRMLPGVRGGDTLTALTHAGRILFLFLFSYGVTKIFHFAVEDTFMLTVTPVYILGSSYALALALSLVAGGIMLFGNFIEPHINKNYGNSEYFALQKKYDIPLAIIFLVLSSVNFFLLLGQYLSGVNHLKVLLPGIITIIMLCIGSGYFYLNYLKSCSRVTLRTANSITTKVTMAFLIASVSVTLLFSPPWKLAAVRTDIRSFLALENAVDNIKYYLARHTKLPETLESAHLATGGKPSLHKLTALDNGKIPTYTHINATDIELCTEFISADSYLGPRVYRYSRSGIKGFSYIPKIMDIDFSLIKPGKYCQRYTVKKVPSTDQINGKPRKINYHLERLP
ncbi:MAG: hypothetical protein H6849_01015 [Alphaproteobacteria bacterium]|nr:MAG: hypothetical protein H6849_01015 [Alphaproteobacteria bacterium]